MRLSALFLTSGSLALIGLLACTEVQPSEDVGPAKAIDGPKKTTSTGSSCLGKEGLAFDNPSCNTCMSGGGCCEATIDCFKNNSECSSLQDCMIACGGGALGPGDGGTESGSVTPGKTSFVTEVYPAVSGTCAGCHLAAGLGPAHFGATADASYTLFKALGFDKPNSAFVLKGAHAGPALTLGQIAIINKWVGLEGGGGGGGGGAGGGGGGGGGGGAGGGGGGGGDGGGGGGGDGGGAGGGTVGCQSACKAKFPAAVAKWTTYNACVAVTCATSCL